MQEGKAVNGNLFRAGI